MHRSFRRRPWPISSLALASPELPPRGHLGYETQRRGQAFQLIVRPEIEARAVVAGIVLDRFDLDLGLAQRPHRLGRIARRLRRGIDIPRDPVVEPGLHVPLLLEGADLVADDA